MSKYLASRIDHMAPSGIRKINEKALEMERKGDHVLHFEVGRPDFDTPKYIKDAGIKSIEDGHVFYTSNFGMPELRQAIAEKLQRENNVDYQAKEVLVTTGLSEAIFDLLMCILEEGDEVLVPNPVWVNYLNIIRVLGAVPVSYSLLEDNQFQPDIQQLREKVTDKTKAILLVTPNNPTGSILNRKTLEEIANVAKEHDLLVISDEVYERILFDGEKHVSIASLEGMKERTLTLNGFSKAYSMTGWRLGYIAAPADLIVAFNKIHQHATSCAASFVQEAGIVALNHEQNEVEEMVKEYLRRRDYLVERINSINGLSCSTPKGSFYLFINAKETGKSCEELCDYLLEEAKVATVPGTVFGSEGEGYIRFSFASSYENIVEGCDRIENALKKL